MTTATKERKTKTRSGGITLNAATLKAAMSAVSQAVPSRHAKPILANVLLADGVLTATDLEVRIDVKIDYHGPQLLLPHARLSAILSASGGEDVTLTQDGTKCTVSCGNGTWTLPTETAAEFPTWTPENAQPLTRLPADQFCRAVRGTVYSTDDESSRYALGAVLVDVSDGTVTFVATDGRRLSACEMEHDLAVNDSKTLIPARAMSIVARVAGAAGDASVQLQATTNELVATIGGTTVTARLVQGSFPRWRDVIPKDGASPSTVLGADLLSATRAAGIVTTENSKGVQYTFTDAGLHLHGQSSEAGESSVTCDLVEFGHKCTVKLDPAYVREWLSGLPVDGEPTVSVQATDAQSAVVLRTDSFTGVIMPLALD